SKSNYSSQRSSSRSHHSSSHRSPSHQSHRLYLHEKYSTFHVHSSDYEVVFVNNETSTNTMNKLLKHVNTCKQYSIDTESERANNQLSLIQINSISIETPSRVMLFELNHLPDQHSQKELEPAKDLIIWPIPAMLIDIQPYYSMWYNWARTQCRVQSLLHRNDGNNDNELTQQHHQQSSCYCHSPSPYK
ncbi:unnamed protein product, partial [Rotaria sp. Silwood1]